MATTGGYVHTQFNDPINLYSKSNVDEAFSMATGGGTGHGGREFDPKRSHVLAYLHEDQHAPPPRHSARIDEPAARKTPTGEVDYPHYRGYVDPNLQSPSFHRIQWATGGPGQRVEESAAQHHHQHQQHHSEVHSATHHSGGTGAAIPAPAPPSVSPGIPKQALYEEPEDSARPLDPHFAAKIAEAERPKVPAQRQPSWTQRAETKHERWQATVGGQSQRERTDWARQGQEARDSAGGTVEQQFGTEVPSWAHKAEQKHQKWEHYAGGNPIEQNRQFQPETPAWAAKSPLGAQDKWEQHYSTYHLSEGKSGADRQRASSEGPGWRNYKIAPVSVEHTAYRTDEWMKPYIAPPLRGGSHGAHTIQTSHSSSHLSRMSGTGGGSGHQQRGYGRTLSSGGTGRSTSGQRTQHDRSWITSSSSTSERQQYSSGGAEQHRATAPAPRPAQIQHNIGTGTTGYSQTVSNRSSSWQHGTDRLGSADAERQKRIMEEELRQRQSQQQSSQVTSYTGSGQQGGTWHVETTPHGGAGQGSTTRTVMVHRGEAGAPAMPQWGTAEGATTKATTSGEYDDPEGHKVHYTKEVYTSSDPGKEFSMLTEEEKKVMDQPLQPGVISRHITTKYYKKSTYTSSTTTGTTGAGPVSSTARLGHNAPLAIEGAKRF